MQTQVTQQPPLPPKTKWYNDKLKLGLSLIIWPVFVYGVYKTSLINKSIKYVIYAFFVLFVSYQVKDNKTSDSGDSKSNTETAVEKDRTKNENDKKLQGVWMSNNPRYPQYNGDAVFELRADYKIHYATQYTGIGQRAEDIWGEYRVINNEYISVKWNTMTYTPSRFDIRGNKIYVNNKIFVKEYN